MGAKSMLNEASVAADAVGVVEADVVAGREVVTAGVVVMVVAVAVGVAVVEAAGVVVSVTGVDAVSACVANE